MVDHTSTGQPRPDRLVMMIVSDTDAEELQSRLVAGHYPVTKVGSTGASCVVAASPSSRACRSRRSTR